MNIIICLDDKNGMMFNKRRQSQDKIVRNDIKKLVNSNYLYMNNYSYNLYKDIAGGNIIVDEDFLNKCKYPNYCLVENKSLNNFINKIDYIIIYRWNRIYPSDLFFDIDLTTSSWQLINTENFPGSSHEKITKEIYRRIN